VISTETRDSPRIKARVAKPDFLFNCKACIHIQEMGGVRAAHRPPASILLSGSAVATQRSWIMISIVLIGVMVDRPALTFRTLTAAALGVLLLAPEAVVHPSFQMSFCRESPHGRPWPFPVLY
jgi:hypothetical protein